jgi:hypothetical protein
MAEAWVEAVGPGEDGEWAAEWEGAWGFGPPTPLAPMSRDEEKEMLKRHLTDLEAQLKEVKKRLEELI